MTTRIDRYRQKLIAHGVSAAKIADLTIEQLICVGNIVEVYEDGQTVETQNPSHAAILRIARVPF